MLASTREVSGALLVALSGCLVLNPEYDSATGSTSRGESGTGGGADTTGAPTTGGAGEVTSVGASEGGSSGGAPTTTLAETTGEVSEGTGSTGAGSSTGELQPACEAPPAEITFEPVFDAYFIRGSEDNSCTFPVGEAPTVASPCDVLNFGKSVYAGVGVLGSMQNMYAAHFDLINRLKEAQVDPWKVIDARLHIVAWSDKWRPAATFDIDLIAPENDWVEGTKDKLHAVDGDSSFSHRKIVQGQFHGWSGTDGPRSDAIPGVKLHVPEGHHGDAHPYQISEPIPRALLEDWVVKQGAEQGIVISSGVEPYLLKILGSCCHPKLVVRYCPV